MMSAPCALVVGLLDVASTDAFHRAGLSVIVVPSLLAGEALVRASLSFQLMEHPTMILLQPQDLYGTETWPLAAQLTIWMQEAIIRPAPLVMLSNGLSDHHRQRAERAGCLCLAMPRSEQDLYQLLGQAFTPARPLSWLDPGLDALTAARLMGERTFFLEAAVVAYHSLRDRQREDRHVWMVDADDVWAALRLVLTSSGYLRDEEALQRGMAVLARLGGDVCARHLLREFAESMLSGLDQQGVWALLNGAGREEIAKIVGTHIDNVSRVWLRKTIAPRFAEWLMRQQFPKQTA